MVEEKPRVQKVLACLYDAEGTVRPKEIATIIGETSLNVGKDLHSLKERGLAVTKVEGEWEITPEGRERIESGGEKEKGKKEGEKETTETVPSQADLFRAEGQRIGFGSRKGDLKLDAVVTYVERIADLDDLNSVWNALTEMGVAGDVKKRWVKLYAQNLPGKEIPEALRERLEASEPDKIRTEAEGISPKPRRFSVVGGEIIGNPEGDYNFSEALQCVAQQRGASPEDASSLALALSKQSTDTLNAIIPLFSRESTSQDNTLVQALKVLKELGIGGKNDEGMMALLSDMRKAMDDMKEDRHREQIISQQQQIQALTGEVRDLKDYVVEMKRPVTGRTEMDILHEVAYEGIGLAKTELSGLRRDIKEAFSSGTLPPPKTPEQREQRKVEYRAAIEKDKEIEELGKRLFFGETTPEEETASAPKPEEEPPKVVPLLYE